MNDKLKEEIRKIQEILKNGGIILYPTDTIWGLGCDATKAVKRIYEIKKRVDNKSMLVLLDDAGKIASYADVPAIALDLIEVADKPTTIIYPGAKRLAPGLIAEDGTIGIRITNIVDYRQNAHTPASPSSIIKLGLNGEIQIIRK